MIMKKKKTLDFYLGYEEIWHPEDRQEQAQEGGREDRKGEKNGKR